MNNTVKTLIFSAAITGILSGTAVRAQAQTSNPGNKQMASAKAGLNSMGVEDKDKHSCKGKNDCKGKGGCATDGSKPPSVA